MALIPGTLPTDTCYGSPQDLLELFAQFLDIPAVALQSKVFFSSSAPTDPTSIWIDTNTPTNPILKLYVPGATPSPWKSYLQSVLDNTPGVGVLATNDNVVIGDTSNSNLLKLTTVSSILSLVPASAPPNGSVTAIKLDGGQSGSAPIFAVRAWVIYNQVTATLLGSGNVSSITDVGTLGRFTVNFGTAFTSLNYAVVGSGQRSVGSPAGIDPNIMNVYLPGGRALGSCNIIFNDVSNTTAESPDASVLFLGTT
jgi:hypothetical protein